MGYENNIIGPKWVLPDFYSLQEQGELARVAKTFNPEDPQAFERRFHERTKDLQVVALTGELLSQLDNTDALDITEGDFARVEYHVAAGSYGDPESKRDWERLKSRMENGEELDMPVIVKVGEVYHKMSGNTRLMVARALGIFPDVAVVDMTEGSLI